MDEYPTRKDRAPALLYRTHPTVWGPADDGPCTSEEVDSYAAGGYLRLAELLSPDEARRYADEFRRLRGEERLAEQGLTAIDDDGDVRSVYDVHRISDAFAELVRDPRIVGRARQMLGSDVSVHQTRATFVPAFGGGEVPWHSCFETWHAEDGMPAPRAVAFSIALTDETVHNGALMVMPGSHKTYVSCVGETPEDHYLDPEKRQEAGLPDRSSLSILAAKYGIEAMTGPAGGATLFDANSMHGAGGNMAPTPRSSLLVVFNSVENGCASPFSADEPRPEFLGARDPEPVR
ncbi:ectoine hydroxylase [Nocardiopsis coralliicola]